METAVLTGGARPVARRHARRRRQCAWGEIAILALIVAVHFLPLVALWRGHSWGAFAEGYAIAVVLLAGRELAVELRGAVPLRDRAHGSTR